MSDWFYPYPALIPGRLVKRYQRFLADVELASGEIVTAHCPNTGPMTGVCAVGSQVFLSESDNPSRKLRYTWELIEVHDTQSAWVGVNTSLPNRVVRAALDAAVFSELANYATIRQEVPYGTDKKSRIDFLLSEAEGQPPAYVEVKNTTWAQQDLALFPDTVTTRGQKHLREMTALRPAARAVMLYFINRGDCTRFAPGDQADPAYGQLLRQAIATGVEVLPCRFHISPAGIRYLGLAELAL